MPSNHNYNLKIEYLSPLLLEGWKDNPRTGNEEAAKKLAKVISEVGFINPVVVDQNLIIRAGHTRTAAAILLGLETIPVITVPFVTEEVAEMYAIADNRASEWTKWNREVLGKVLLERQTIDVKQMSRMTGFSPSEIGGLQHFVSSRDGEEDTPELPNKPITKRGDVYTLGSHRLMCGDSASKNDVQQLMRGQISDLAHTDPPYNVEVQPRSNIARKLGTIHNDRYSKLGAVKNDAVLRPKDRVLVEDFDTNANFSEKLKAWFNNISDVLKPGGAFYIWGGYSNIANYPNALLNAKLYFSQCIVWSKQPVMTRRDYMGAHELAFYGWKEGASHYFHPDIKNARDVWEVANVARVKMVHLTEKPVELARRAIEYSSRCGEFVIDFFAGSGSTIIAGEELGRAVYAMEIDEAYCDVIVARWEQFTNQKARKGDARCARIQKTT